MIVLIAFAIVFIYAALYYVASGRDEAVPPSLSQVSRSKIFRNLALAVAIFILLDGVIFHTSLYQSMLEPRSNAGRVAALLREEKQRRPSGDKEIIVLGDSRMGIGFSEEIANAIAAERNVNFVNRSMPESLPRLWYYLLREIDPSASRYQAIVLPLKLDLDPAPLHTTPVHISQTAPLLHYTDAFSFAASFDHWQDQSRAFAACLLRGIAFQPDVLNFLEHPLQRISHLRQPPREVRPQAFRQHAQRDVVGLEYDAATNELKIPERLSKRQRSSIQNSIQQAKQVARSATCGSNCYDWTRRILERYDLSETSVVLVHLPKGPLGLEETNAANNTAAEAFRGHRVVMFDPAQFAFLEQPAYYMDGSHLNGKGQEQFTRRLTEDLLAQFDSQRRGEPKTNEVDAGRGPPMMQR
jgi:hypothetical protein